MVGGDEGPDWVVMSGGAARGVFMLGALDVLVRERGLRPRSFAGVSVGAVLAAQLASAPPGDLSSHLADLTTLWLEEVPARMRGRRPRRVLTELLAERFDAEALRTSGRAYVGGAVDVVTGRFVTCTERDVDADRLLGMTTIPFWNAPVPIGDERWVDGVLRRILPLHAVLARGPRHVLLMTAGAPALGRGRRGWLRLLEIAAHELVFVKELRAAVAVRRAGGPRIEILTPLGPLPGPLRFDADALRRSYEHGRQVARGEGWRWADGPLPETYAAFAV